MTAATNDFFFSSADGLRLYCRIYGAALQSAPPVLCLPGLTRNSRDFVQLAERLSRHRTVLTADLRGRGRSQYDSDASHYQLSYYVRDAWSLLDSLKLERVTVVGTSLGALMAIVMAAMQPHRIVSIVLNDAGPQIDPAGLRRIAGYAGTLPPVRSWSEATQQTRSVYEAAMPGLSDQEWLAYARAGYREDSNGTPVPDLDPAIAQAFKNTVDAPADLWSLYAEIKDTPMLILRGAHSDILNAATVERMVREKPHVHHVTVDNRGHTPTLDEPVCVSAMDAFLELSSSLPAQASDSACSGYY